MFVFKMLIILKVLNNKLSSLQNRMKEKDDKIGDLVNRFNDMECRELENNQQPTHGKVT